MAVPKFPSNIRMDRPLDAYTPQAPVNAPTAPMPAPPPTTSVIPTPPTPPPPASPGGTTRSTPSFNPFQSQADLLGTASSLMGNLPIPGVSTAVQSGLSSGLKGAQQLMTPPDIPPPPTGAGGGLGELPRYTPGNFADWLANNPIPGLTAEQIAAEARRLRDLKVNPQKAALEEQRRAFRERADQAMSRVGEGRDAAVRGINKALKEGLQRGQARAIRNNLVSSNIPETTDFRPMEQEALNRVADIDQAIANRKAELQMEAQLGDQDAMRRLTELEAAAAEMEAQLVTDLTNRERDFAERARGNRFQEFMGGETLKQGQYQSDMDRAKLEREQRETDLNNWRTQQDQAYDRWLKGMSFALDMSRLENQEADRDLQRKLQEYELGELIDPNSYTNRSREADLRYKDAQTQSLLNPRLTGSGTSSPPSMTPSQRQAFETGIGESVTGILNGLAQGGDPTLVEGRINHLRSQWDSANGPGSFDMVFGPSIKAATKPPASSTTPPAPPSTFSSNPTIAAQQKQEAVSRYQANIASDQERLQTLTTNVQELEKLHASAPTNALPGAVPPRTAIVIEIERLQKEIDSLRSRIEQNTNAMNALIGDRTGTGVGNI